MKDIYLYDDVAVLKNRLNIKNEEQLNKAESDITCIRLLDIDKRITGGIFDYDRLKAIHQYIFGDIYAWAGAERAVPIVKGERVLGGDTVRYSIPGCIEKDAKKAFLKGEGYTDCIRRMNEVVAHLKGDLDFSYELSYNLYGLYDYVQRCLSKSVYKNDVKELKGASSVMTSLREAFNEVARQDASLSVMRNTQRIAAGYTYGRSDVCEMVVGAGNRGYFA